MYCLQQFIDGATALIMAMGVGPSLIKNKGRWASGVYEIYCRVCKGKMLELSHLMSRADTNQWLSKNDGFFDTAAGCEPDPEDVAVSEDGDSDRPRAKGAVVDPPAAKRRFLGVLG